MAHRVSACGAANFEEVPGREQYGAGDDATAQWVEDMLAFHEENFQYDNGMEVRSMDRRELLEVKEEERRGGRETRRKREELKKRRKEKRRKERPCWAPWDAKG